MEERRRIDTTDHSTNHAKLLIELLHQEPMSRLNPVINWDVLSSVNPVLYHELQLIKLKSNPKKD